MADQKNLEKVIEELQAKINELENANRIKSDFLAGMGHHLRTPMNSIMGFTDLAMTISNPKKTQEYLELIKTNSFMLLHIINNILDFAKGESLEAQVEKTPFYLSEIFDNCRIELAPAATLKGLRIQFYAGPIIREMLVGDPIRLQRVLTNFLTNAIKHTHVGTVKVFASITAQTKESVTIRFEVTDSGVGMTEEQVRIMQEPYSQANLGDRLSPGGKGLGIPVSKRLIEAMGGTLQIESAVDKGSKLFFELEFETIDSIYTP